MQKSMQLIDQNLSHLSHARSLFEVFMIDRPSFDFSNSKHCVFSGDILTWGRFDAVDQARPWQLDCKHTKNVYEGQNVRENYMKSWRK